MTTKTSEKQKESQLSLGSPHALRSLHMAMRLFRQAKETEIYS